VFAAYTFATLPVGRRELDRAHRHQVRHDVVGVRVAAVLRVGDDDVRTRVADHVGERACGDVEVHARERPLRDGRRVLVPSGVGEAELVRGVEPDRGDRVGELVLTHARHADRIERRGVERRVEHLARGAVGAGHERDVRALVDVARGGRRTLRRLVVRVRMDEQERRAGRARSCGRARSGAGRRERVERVAHERGRRLDLVLRAGEPHDHRAPG
jgi:hypothetical protein